MYKIRSEQVRKLDGAARESFIDRMTHYLGQKYPGRIAGSETELRVVIRAWDEDARLWGLRNEDGIASYIEAVAVSRVDRSVLGPRVETYLRIYHAELVNGVDLGRLVERVFTRAAAHHIGDEEAVAWLATISLIGQARREDDAWFDDILSRPGSDEARMQLVHEEAARRGWVAREGGAR